MEDDLPDTAWGKLVDPVKRQLTARGLFTGRLFLLSLLPYFFSLYGSSWSTELWVVTLPYILILLGAALAPARMPPDAGLVVAFCFALLVLLDGRSGYIWWHDVAYASHVRGLRAFVSLTWSFGSALTAIEVYRSHAARFWRPVRLYITLGTLVRLIVASLLRVLDAPYGAYPPAHISFEASLLFNFCCLLLSELLLLPSCRTSISQITGGAKAMRTLPPTLECMHALHFAHVSRLRISPYSHVLPCRRC